MRLERCTSLLVDLRHGEVLRFDDAGIEVELVHKSGRLARLHVRAPVGQGVTHQHGDRQGHDPNNAARALDASETV